MIEYSCLFWKSSNYFFAATEVKSVFIRFNFSGNRQNWRKISCHA